jgi:hypothetical protein
VNVNDFELELIAPKFPEAAFVAVTTQVVAELADNVPFVTEQPKPDTSNEIAPEPDPPAVVSVIGVPTVPLNSLFAIDSEDCVTRLTDKDTATVDVDAVVPFSVLVTVTK